MIRSNRKPQAELSFPLECCLAKTRDDITGHTPGIDVFGHCVIVGEVARALIGYTIPAVRKILFPAGSELVAAAHDVGKICPTFQEKIRRNIDGYEANSLSGLETARPDMEKEWKGHAAVSRAALEDCPKFIPEIVGRHHGFSTVNHPADSAFFGGESWQKLREDSITRLKDYFAVDWPEVKDNTHAAALSGLTTVADWIGSGSAFDWIENIGQAGDLPRLARDAVEKAGFIRPPVTQGLSFEKIFKFAPYPAQTQFIEAVSSPGVYVLEAPMGMGKTEAALYAAYRALAEGRASGIYFALPTRLTSDKIYERMGEFLDGICADKRLRPLLLHSSAYLSQTEMGGEAEPGASWFNSKKRSILAPFAAGTIDQALMAVMNVKHGFVRTFGLAGKAVILDEVHSYDSYTGTLLQKLVRELRELGCTVIILSATLTGERRKELLDSGGSAAGFISRADSSYPLISLSTQKHAAPREIPAEAPAALPVAVCRIDDDSLAIEESLRRAEQGQQVLWIENIVAGAQERYLMFSARAAEYAKAGLVEIETGLLHSRFVPADRKVNEDKWVELFGTRGLERRAKRGRILVGTQVLEQSLDIDADFLVTRFCPTDMLLQRIGRLWRHRSTNPLRPKGARPEAWILAADYKQALENYRKAFEKSAPVYDPYVLLRTLEVWERMTSLSLPGDIRRLVEETYKDRDEDGLPGRLKNELAKKRDHLKGRALQNIAHDAKTEADSETNTRYSEEETVDVLLLRSAGKNDDGGISLVLSDGTSLELLPGLKKTNRKEWRERALALSRHIVTVNKRYAPPPWKEYAAWFKGYVYTGNDDDRDPLRIALVNEGGYLEDRDHNAFSGDFELSYYPHIGYQAKLKGS
jgi:CRISPR-associated endonuclease/helicase Cas3